MGRKGQKGSGRRGGEGGTDLLEGRNVVLECLRSGREINRILIDTGALKGRAGGKIGEIVESAKERKIPVTAAERAELDKISITGSHQGVIAEAARKGEVSLTGLLKSLRGKKEPFLVVLGEVMYEQNLGAILRTAEGAGVDGIVIPKRRTAPLSPTVARVSMGASEYVPLIRESTTSALSILKREGVMIFGVEADARLKYYEADLTGSTALVFGGEDRSLTQTVRDRCDEIISIPLMGKIGSLNVGVSVGIVLFERVRQEGVRGG